MVTQRQMICTDFVTRSARGLALAALTVWFLPNIAAAALDRIVAIVNDDVVLESALRIEIERISQDLRGRGTEPPARETLVNQVLDHLIMQELQLQLARQTGIRVEDEELNFTLQNIAERNNVSIGEMRDSLAEEGIRFAEFREQIRKEMILTRLRQRDVIQRIRVSDREIDNFLTANQGRGDARRFQLAHILIALPEGATQKQIADARERGEDITAQIDAGTNFAELAVRHSAGQNALEGGDLGWRTLGELPTLFADAVRALELGAVSPLLQSPGGFHLIRLVDVQGEREQRLIEQRQVRHILIKVDENLASEQARHRLGQLRQRIEAGEDFSALAQAHSDDPASAVRGGELGWVSPGDMVPQFDNAASALEVGTLSQPVRTDFGWHLIEVLGVRQHDGTADHLRVRAIEQIRARKADERVRNWMRRMRDEAYVEVRI